MMNMHTDPGSGHLSGRKIDEVIDVEGTKCGRRMAWFIDVPRGFEKHCGPHHLLMDVTRSAELLKPRVGYLCWLRQEFVCNVLFCHQLCDLPFVRALVYFLCLVLGRCLFRSSVVFVALD